MNDVLVKARLRPKSRGLRCALLALLLSLGFAASYPLVSGSHAATAGTTTVPNPDPPPTPPPPPPPAAPAQRTKPKPRHAKRHQAVHKHRRAVATPDAPPKPPPPKSVVRLIKKPALAASVAPAAASSNGSQGSIRLLLGVCLGLLLLLLTAVLAPARALPQPVFQLLDGRREVVLTAALALGLGIAVGLVVVAGL